ncbi:hypothetical protein pb186bvf_003976 [Paramecium bursaria]
MKGLFEEFLIVGYNLESNQYKIMDYLNPITFNNQPPDYLQNIQIMCFTEQIDLNLQIDDLNSKNYLHQFILTDSRGVLRYCTSLVIYEKHQNKFIPYSYVLVSSYQNLIQQKHFMTSLYNGIFDHLSRYKDRGWQMDGLIMKNQHFLEYYLSLASSKIQGIYFLPKQIPRGNKQEVINDIIIDNPRIRQNLYNQDISFQALFQKLSMTSVIKLVQCIILEKQIILFSNQVWDLANIAEALLSFIYPLKWRCIYIPYLPAQLIDTLHASVPYIIGVHKNEKERVLTVIDCFDKVLVDLDQDRVIGGNVASLFPDEPVFALIKACEQFNTSYIYDPAKMMQIQGNFLKFMIRIINNFTCHFLYSEISDDFQNIEEIFQTHQYIEMFQPLEQEFYRELVNKTMMFPRFLEDAYKFMYKVQFKKQNPTDDDQVLFINIIRQLNQNSVIIINKTQKIIIDSIINDIIEKIQLQDNESDKSAHILFQDYLSKLKIKKFNDKPFPIQSIDKSKIISMDENKPKQQQIVAAPRSLLLIQQVSEQIDSESPANKALILKSVKIQKYFPSMIRSDADTIKFILNYPKSSRSTKVIKLNLKQIMISQMQKLEDCKNLTPIKSEQSQLQQSVFQEYSVRSSKKIFSPDQNGYVSMFKTKSYTSLRNQ